MGLFDDMVRNMVKEELAKAAQTGTGKTPDAAGAGAAQPEAAAKVSEPINKAQPENGKPETEKPESAAPKENADIITISRTDFQKLVADAVREGSAAALNANGTGGAHEQPDPLRAMANICGLAKREE